MHFTQAIASAILLFSVTGLAAPAPQLAGEGAACNSLLSGTDNAVGYGVEDAEDNIAGNVATIKSAVSRLRLRQLAGEGAACDSLLSGTDNAVGYGVEDAEDNIAGNVKSTRRQLDKVANGLGSIGKAAGVNTATDPVVAVGDSVDGSLTSGAANLGASLADTEVSTAESIGKSVPRA